MTDSKSSLDSLSKDELFALRKDISRSIGSLKDDERMKAIEKNRQISELIKLKYPKNKDQLRRVQNKIQKKKNRILVSCDQCHNTFDTSIKNKNPFAFCKGCRKKRDLDLVEIIRGDGETVIYQEKDLKKAESELVVLSANVRLDLHGVLDVLKDDVKVSTNAMVLSYVGKLTRTRTNALRDIKNRIKKGQVKFGVLVFKRGKRGTGVENKFQSPGSKAWVNKLIKFEDNAIFVDDSTDHYNSVKSLNITNLESVLFKGSAQELIDLLAKRK